MALDLSNKTTSNAILLNSSNNKLIDNGAMDLSKPAKQSRTSTCSTSSSASPPISMPPSMINFANQFQNCGLSDATVKQLMMSAITSNNNSNSPLSQFAQQQPHFDGSGGGVGGGGCGTGNNMATFMWIQQLLQRQILLQQCMNSFGGKEGSAATLSTETSSSLDSGALSHNGSPSPLPLTAHHFQTIVNANNSLLRPSSTSPGSTNRKRSIGNLSITTLIFHLNTKKKNCFFFIEQTKHSKTMMKNFPVSMTLI